MGIVDDVGPEVKNFKKGDRVVACFRPRLRRVRSRSDLD